jgi:hypothetical protein
MMSAPGHEVQKHKDSKQKKTKQNPTSHTQ